MHEPGTIAIGELSRRTGCNIETIRYYERIELLPKAGRTRTGYRVYGAADVRRLSFIRRARELGFTLSEVRALLRLAGPTPDSCAQVRKLAAKHLTDVRAKLADLRAMERALVKAVRDCGLGRKSGCPLIDTLAA